MSANQRYTEERIGLTRRVAGILLVLATVMTWVAGVARKRNPRPHVAVCV
jgi:hypothetical protein